MAQNCAHSKEGQKSGGLKVTAASTRQKRRGSWTTLDNQGHGLGTVGGQGKGVGGMLALTTPPFFSNWISLL